MIQAMQNTSLLLAQRCIFFATEQLSKACLHLDPGTRQRLQTLSGKCIAFHLRDQLPFYENGISVFVFPSPAGIELSADTCCIADASIALHAKDLLLLLRQPAALENIVVEGDHELLLSVLDVIKHFDIDWEQAIAPVTGDVIAHQLGKQMRATEKWFSQSFQEAKRLAEEYLEEELPIARQSPQLKPVFDGMEKIRAMGSSLREGWIKK